MKRNFLWIILLVGILFAAGCGDEDPKPDPTPPLEGYTVLYRLSAFGNPDSIDILYYVPGRILINVKPDKTPWEAQGNIFELLDSVGMFATIYPHANRPLTYEYEISVSKGGEFLKGTNGSLTIPVGDVPTPVHINWAEMIEQ